ncbi:MAG TPA: septation protein SpoVG family protein [Symbiobacteriaceae bacterium]|nr:septation protein SpoVG family protein [Symbiobacteriaceae bacterium]
MSENRPQFIPVTRVELHDLGGSGPTKAIGSVMIGNVFVVHGVRVVDSEKGLFVAMPQRKDGDRYRDVAHPVTSEMRAIVGSAVLEEYQRNKTRDSQERGRG